jgi:hypothetical protein
MRKLFGNWQTVKFPNANKFLFRSLTYFKTIDANFYVPSCLIFTLIN